MRVKFDEAAYEPMAIEGLYLGQVGADRGKFFILSPTGMQRMKAAVNTPAMHAEIAAVRKQAVPHQLITEEMRASLDAAFKKAKWRATETKKVFDLDKEWLVAQFAKQEGVCALTGMDIRPQFLTASRRNPFAPSIDRIDAALGYTRENSQITTVIANIAKSDFALEDFHTMCAHTAFSRRLLVPSIAAANQKD